MHTFDIRFARSLGLAGLFEAPANRLGWKGAGKLSIDSQGISIAMQRGLLTLFSRRARRFAARSLTEVYREGAELRLEFSTDDAREVLPLWTSGSETAAEIVKRLPTRQTVELEHSTSSASAYRFDWRLFASMTVLGLAIAVMAFVLQRSRAQRDAPAATILPASVTREREVETPMIAASPTESAAPSLPMDRTSPAYPAARRHVQVFESDLAALRAEYIAVMEAPSPLRLYALSRKWDMKIQQVENSLGMQQLEFRELREIQLRICRDWRDFLRGYSEGLSAQDLGLVNVAFAAREHADVMNDRMNWYVPR